MRATLLRLTSCVAVLGMLPVVAQDLPTVPAETLLDRAVLSALDAELSGTAAKDHVARLTQMHRVPASPGFHDAIDCVMSRARAFGLSRGLAEAAKGMLTTVTASGAEQDRTTPRAVDRRVPVRNPTVKGPLAPGGEWVIEKAGAGAARIAVARVPNSGDVTYEIVNFVDGVRTVSDIRNAVSAEFEPIAVTAVAEYLDVLAKAAR